MATPFETQQTECCQLLQQQIDSLTAVRDDSLASAKEADRMIKPLTRALAGLRSPQGSSGKRPDKKSCSNMQEIGELIDKALSQNGKVPKGDLKDLVADALRARGRNLSIFAKLFGECLKAPSLRIDNAGVVSRVGEPSQHRRGT